MREELKELNKYLRGLENIQSELENNSETHCMVEFEILKVLIKINQLEKTL